MWHENARHQHPTRRCSFDLKEQNRRLRCVEIFRSRREVSLDIVRHPYRTRQHEALRGVLNTNEQSARRVRAFRSAAERRSQLGSDGQIGACLLRCGVRGRRGVRVCADRERAEW